MREEDIYGLVELIFAFGVVMAIGVWQLISVKRALREPPKKDKPDEE